jgi:hypothetical protein
MGITTEIGVLVTTEILEQLSELSKGVSGFVKTPPTPGSRVSSLPGNLNQSLALDNILRNRQRIKTKRNKFHDLRR